MERKKQSRPKKPAVVLEQSKQPNEYNEDYENAKKGIIPPRVLRKYKQLNPEKHPEKKKIPPFELHNISQLAVFNREQAKKLMIASLYSRAEDYDPLKVTYKY
jgi:hypothetical protein